MGHSAHPMLSPLMPNQTTPQSLAYKDNINSICMSDHDISSALMPDFSEEYRSAVKLTNSCMIKYFFSNCFHVPFPIMFALTTEKVTYCSIVVKRNANLHIFQPNASFP